MNPSLSSFPGSNASRSWWNHPVHKKVRKKPAEALDALAKAEWEESAESSTAARALFFLIGEGNEQAWSTWQQVREQGLLPTPPPQACFGEPWHAAKLLGTVMRRKDVDAQTLDAQWGWLVDLLAPTQEATQSRYPLVVTLFQEKGLPLWVRLVDQVDLEEVAPADIERLLRTSERIPGGRALLEERNLVPKDAWTLACMAARQQEPALFATVPDDVMLQRDEHQQTLAMIAASKVRTSVGSQRDGYTPMNPEQLEASVQRLVRTLVELHRRGVDLDEKVKAPKRPSKKKAATDQAEEAEGAAPPPAVAQTKRPYFACKKGENLWDAIAAREKFPDFPKGLANRIQGELMHAVLGDGPRAKSRRSRL